MTSEMCEKAARLTGRPVYDRREILINQLIAANRVLIRALDGGDVSEEELNKAREIVR